MTRNIWIDLQMSLAEIEAEISDIPDELLRIPTVGNAMGRRVLKGSDRRCTQPQPHVWPSARAVSSVATRPAPRCKCSSRRMMTAAPGACAPSTPGGEEAGSRANGFR